MTLIVDILDRAARQCSVSSPSNWVTSQDLSALEIRDFMGETVDDILSRIETPQPIGASATITGDGGATYALPASFKRLKRGAYAVRERDDACIPVADDGDWSYLVHRGSTGGDRYFRVTGIDGAFSMEFYRPLEAGAEVSVEYVSTLWAQSATGDGIADLSAGDDISRLPRRIIEAGIVWRWRERKGLDFGGKLAEYEAMLARFSSDSRTARVVSFGKRNVYKPFDVPVPDFIPGA